MSFACRLSPSDKQWRCFCFRNRSGTTKEQQTAYAEYYQNEETAAVAQQLELVCVH